MTVWNEDHPKPSGGDEHERALVRWITEDSQRQMAALVPKDRESVGRFREIVGGAVDVMVGRSLPSPGEVKGERRGEEKVGTTRLQKYLVRYLPGREEVPAVVLLPEKWNKQVVVWIEPAGKQAVFEEEGKPKPAVAKLLAAGAGVIAADLFGQGEFTDHGTPIEKARLNGKDNPYAGYTFGYNHPVFSKRVHDVLTLVRFAHQLDGNVKSVCLVGMAGAGHWVAAARAQAGEAVDRAAIDTGGFRFARLRAIDDPDFLPGGAKYLDLPGMVALAAPQETWLAGESKDGVALIRATFDAAASPDRLTFFQGSDDEKINAAVQWLLR